MTRRRVPRDPPPDAKELDFLVNGALDELQQRYGSWDDVCRRLLLAGFQPAGEPPPDSLTFIDYLYMTRGKRR